ncbi:Glycosyl transferase family 13 [Trinorchestia longiramus]|nr:Glycosyl transferase family 13 [Trinorchestia longiramus]
MPTERMPTDTDTTSYPPIPCEMKSSSQFWCVLMLWCYVAEAGAAGNHHADQPYYLRAAEDEAKAGAATSSLMYIRPPSLTFGTRERLETQDWLHFQKLKVSLLKLHQLFQIVDLPPWADPTELTNDTWPHHGVTVLVISPTGHVKARERFVTYQPGQSLQLLRFVASLQPGNLLLFLAVPEWVLFMSEETKAALGYLGFLLGGVKTCNSEAWVGAAILGDSTQHQDKNGAVVLHTTMQTRRDNAGLVKARTDAGEGARTQRLSEDWLQQRRLYEQQDAVTREGKISRDKVLFEEDKSSRGHSSDSMPWKGQVVAEAIATTTKAPRPISLTFNLPMKKLKSTNCNWHKDTTMEAQRKFCLEYDGYDDLCGCHDPLTSVWRLKQPLIKIREEIPFAVVTAKSPRKLYRTLRSLFNASGSSQTKLLLVIDGIQEEVVALAQVLKVPFVVHTPQGRPGSNVRPNTNVRFALESVFDVFPNCDKAVILEDDLIVSPDIIRYFQETSWLLDADPTILAVNAFSYNSVSGVAADTGALKRVEAYPYYGWMVSRDVARQVVENWMNDEEGDWDKWMLRDNRTRQGRDVVVPEVSRTYHDGGLGVHVSGFVQAVFYEKIIVNTDRNAVLQDLNKSGPFVTYVSASSFLDEALSFTTIMMRRDDLQLARSSALRCGVSSIQAVLVSCLSSIQAVLVSCLSSIQAVLGSCLSFIQAVLYHNLLYINCDHQYHNLFYIHCDDHQYYNLLYINCDHQYHNLIHIHCDHQYHYLHFRSVSINNYLSQSPMVLSA